MSCVMNDVPVLMHSTPSLFTIPDPSMLGWHGGSGCKPHTLRQHGKGPLIEEKALIGNQVVPRGSKHQTMHALGEWAPAPAQFIQGSMHSSQGEMLCFAMSALCKSQMKRCSCREHLGDPLLQHAVTCFLSGPATGSSEANLLLISFLFLGRKWLRENTHLEEKGSRQAEK